LKKILTVDFFIHGVILKREYKTPSVKTFSSYILKKSFGSLYKLVHVNE